VERDDEKVVTGLLSRTPNILSVQNLAISFGNNHVLKSLNFELGHNEILGVIGPNGAGKTVMLNILTGILKPTAGKILFKGEDITATGITERVRMGFGRTFQIPRSFEKMTAYENIMCGGVYGDGLSEKHAGDRAWDILETIGLRTKAYTFAGKLNLLDRKRLEIGSAMASNPEVLFLDEVAGGLTETEVVEILKIVRSLKDGGCSIIWIEHVIQTMLHGTDRILLLSEGRDIITGLPYDVMTSEECEIIYLGVKTK